MALHQWVNSNLFEGCCYAPLDVRFLGLEHRYFHNDRLTLAPALRRYGSFV